jgi:phytoene synthase
LYLPISESSLHSLDEAHVRANEIEFRRFIREQLDRFLVWQSEAERGYRLIPKRYRIPIKTAGDMYKWTAHSIATDPFVVFHRKIKPRRARVVLTGLLNVLAA